MAQPICDNILWSAIGVIIKNFIIFLFEMRDFSYGRVSFFIIFQEVGIKDSRQIGEVGKTNSGYAPQG